MSAAAFIRLDRQYEKDRPAGSGDEIPADMCRRGGFRGPHASPADCIDALRSRVAVLEFKSKQPGGRPRSRIQSGRTEWGVDSKRRHLPLSEGWDGYPLTKLALAFELFEHYHPDSGLRDLLTTKAAVPKGE